MPFSFGIMHMTSQQLVIYLPTTHLVVIPRQSTITCQLIDKGLSRIMGPDFSSQALLGVPRRVARNEIPNLEVSALLFLGTYAQLYPQSTSNSIYMDFTGAIKLHTYHQEQCYWLDFLQEKKTKIHTKEAIKRIVFICTYTQPKNYYKCNSTKN